MTVQKITSYTCSSALELVVGLVGEYAYDRQPNRPMPLPIIQATTVIHETLSESFFATELKAAQMIDQFLDEQIIIFPLTPHNDSSLLRHRIYPLLIDLAADPYSAHFLHVIRDVIKKKLATVCFYQRKLTDSMTSLAESEDKTEFQQLGLPSLRVAKAYKITFSFGEALTTLLDDKKGRWYIERLSFVRVFFHEWVHILHFSTNANPFADCCLEKCFYLTNKEEKKTIFDEIFSENSWARARGEKARLTHKIVPIQPDKNQQLLTALSWGANGTLEELIREAVHREHHEGSLDELSQSATILPILPRGLSMLKKQQIHRSALELIQKELTLVKKEEVKSNTNKLVNLEKLNDRDIVNIIARHSKTGIQHKGHDKWIKVRRSEQVCESYCFLISSLHIMGKIVKAMQIENLAIRTKSH